MKIALLGLAALTALAGCTSEDQNRKTQVRDHLVNQCNMQAQMAAQMGPQSGLPDMRPLCACIGTTIDNMPIEQFKQMTANPMQASQFSQTINSQCMQRLGPSMMGGGMGGMGGMQPGMGPAMQPGMQPNVGPGMYGGTVQGGGNASGAANVTQ